MAAPPIEPLTLHGIGLCLTTPRSVRDEARAQGADPSSYRGWPNFCVAEADQHPSTLGARALEAALAHAGVKPGELGLVLSVGVSRDYPPSWSVATEIIDLLGASETCLGLDMTIGCLGTLCGLEVAQGWSLEEGKCAAIVAAERWSHTVDRSDGSRTGLWGHGDGAGALVVRAKGRPALARYRGSCFRSDAAQNGRVLVKYGGTRFPVAPPGESPHERRLSSMPREEVHARYRHGYQSVIAGIVERFGVRPDRIVCNQVAPGLNAEIAELAAVEEDRLVVSGTELGHLGSVDIVVGLARLAEQGALHGDILLAASTPHSFGASLLQAP